MYAVVGDTAEILHRTVSDYPDLRDEEPAVPFGLSGYLAEWFGIYATNAVRRSLFCAYANRATRRWKACARLCSEILRKRSREMDLQERATAQERMGEALVMTGEHRAALKSFREARTAYDNMGYTAGVTNADGNIGQALLALGEHEGARSATLRALRAFQSAGDEAGIGICAHTLAKISRRIDTPQTEVEYLQTALRAARRAGNLNLEYSVLERLSEVGVSRIIEEGRPSPAIDVDKEARLLRDALGGCQRR